MAQLQATLDTQAIEFIKANYDVRYNLVTGLIIVNGEPINDKIQNSMLLKVRQELATSKIGKDLLMTYMLSDNFDTYDPLCDWLQSLGANITDRKPIRIKPSFTPWTDRLASTLGGTEDYQKYVSYFLLRWGLGLVWQATGIYRNLPNTLMPVLVGPQNGGKTSWIRGLFDEELQPYIKERLPGETEKDENYMMTTNLVIYDEEFGNLKGKTVEHLKAMLSRDVVAQRPTYGSHFIIRPRRCSFIATSNPTDFITDPTGNRRIVPIYTNGINWDIYNEMPKHLVVQEWVNLYNEGMDFRLTNEDIAYLNTYDQAHRESTSEEEIFLRVFDIPDPDRFYTDGDGKYFTVADVMQILGERYTHVKLNRVTMGKVCTKYSLHKDGRNRYKLLEKVRYEPPGITIHP